MTIEHNNPPQLDQLFAKFEEACEERDEEEIKNLRKAIERRQRHLRLIISSDVIWEISNPKATAMDFIKKVFEKRVEGS